jgi:hypothetical protein
MSERQWLRSKILRKCASSSVMSDLSLNSCRHQHRGFHETLNGPLNKGVLKKIGPLVFRLSTLAITSVVDKSHTGFIKLQRQCESARKHARHKTYRVAITTAGMLSQAIEGGVCLSAVLN